jgi:hypothetical protein
MAKLNARKSHEVAKVWFAQTLADGSQVVGILALRSDRKVLRRFTGDLSTGYSIFTTLAADAALNRDALVALCEQRGWAVSK